MLLILGLGASLAVLEQERGKKLIYPPAYLSD